MRIAYVTAAARLLLIGVPTWLLEGAVSLTLLILGLFVIPVGAYFTVTRISQYWERQILAFAWPVLWPLGNEEDGIDGLRGGDVAQSWWAQRTEGYPIQVRIFLWSALRNPVSNLRFIAPFGFHIDSAKVRWVGNSLDPDADYAKQPGTYFYYAWCGAYSGMWLIYRGWQVRLGWKILPRDSLGLAADDYRLKGCGTALQIQKKA